MKVIGTQGDEVYLVETAPDRGRVLDMAQGALFPEQLIGSIVKWGYWEPHTMPDDELKVLLAKVKDLPPDYLSKMTPY